MYTLTSICQMLLKFFSRSFMTHPRDMVSNRQAPLFAYANLFLTDCVLRITATYRNRPASALVSQFLHLRSHYWSSLWWDQSHITLRFQKTVAIWKFEASRGGKESFVSFMLETTAEILWPPICPLSWRMQGRTNKSAPCVLQMEWFGYMKISIVLELCLALPENGAYVPLDSQAVQHTEENLHYKKWSSYTSEDTPISSYIYGWLTCIRLDWHLMDRYGMTEDHQHWGHYQGSYIEVGEPSFRSKNSIIAEPISCLFSYYLSASFSTHTII